MNVPQEIRLNGERNQLMLVYADGQQALSAEYLRVFSPSAEVRGHGVGQETLQTGKRWVRITDLEAIGHYALKITFSDGHDSGLYDWDYLADLAANQEAHWQDYLRRLAMAGSTREFDEAANTQNHQHACGGSCSSKH